MNVISQLKKEHRDINLMLAVLEKICVMMQRGEKVDKRHLESILEFFVTFVGQCHIAKEEEMLFPAMEQAGIPKGGGPIGELRSVHIIARSHISAMHEALRKYTRNVTHDSVFEQNACEYIELLKAHIHAEDTLFALADTYIAPDMQQNLMRVFKQFENKVGACSQKKFHKTVNRLKVAYL